MSSLEVITANLFNLAAGQQTTYVGMTMGAALYSQPSSKEIGLSNGLQHVVCLVAMVIPATFVSLDPTLRYYKEVSDTPVNFATVVPIIASTTPASGTTTTGNEPCQPLPGVQAFSSGPSRVGNSVADHVSGDGSGASGIPQGGDGSGGGDDVLHDGLSSSHMEGNSSHPPPPPPPPSPPSSSGPEFDDNGIPARLFALWAFLLLACIPLGVAAMVYRLAQGRRSKLRNARLTKTTLASSPKRTPTKKIEKISLAYAFPTSCPFDGSEYFPTPKPTVQVAEVSPTAVFQIQSKSAYSAFLDVVHRGYRGVQRCMIENLLVRLAISTIMGLVVFWYQNALAYGTFEHENMMVKKLIKLESSSVNYSITVTPDCEDELAHLNIDSVGDYEGFVGGMTAGVHVEPRVSTFIEPFKDKFHSSESEGPLPDFAHSEADKSSIFSSDSGVVGAGEVADIVVELPDEEVVVTSDEVPSVESDAMGQAGGDEVSGISEAASLTSDIMEGSAGEDPSIGTIRDVPVTDTLDLAAAVAELMDQSDVGPFPNLSVIEEVSSSLEEGRAAEAGVDVSSGTGSSLFPEVSFFADIFQEAPIFANDNGHAVDSLSFQSASCLPPRSIEVIEIHTLSPSLSVSSSPSPLPTISPVKGDASISIHPNHHQSGIPMSKIEPRDGFRTRRRRRCRPKKKKPQIKDIASTDAMSLSAP